MKKEEDMGSTKKGSPHNPHEEKQRECWDGGKGKSQRDDGSAAGLGETGWTAQESVLGGKRKKEETRGREKK